MANLKTVEDYLTLLLKILFFLNCLFVVNSHCKERAIMHFMLHILSAYFSNSSTPFIILLKYIIMALASLVSSRTIGFEIGPQLASSWTYCLQLL